MGRVDLLRYDLATAEKLPVIRRLLGSAPPTPCLDVGSGTGDLTVAVFPEAAPVAVDAWLPNLDSIRREHGGQARLLAASGDCLALRGGAIGTLLCSEVLEHIDDDRAVIAELARVLRPGGRLVVTVPCLYFGIDTYLRLLRVRSVHDFPGPERHVRRGYRESDLRELFGAAGLEVEEVVYLFKPFAKLAIDIVAAAHLVYQRVVHRRRQWTWSDVATPAMSNSAAFRAYRLLYPLLSSLSIFDRLFRFRGGFGIAVRATRRAG